MRCRKLVLAVHIPNKCAVQKFKMNFGIDKYDALKFLYNLAHFRFVRFEKFAACRNIEKQIFTKNEVPSGQEHGSCFNHFGGGDFNKVPQSQLARRVRTSTPAMAAIEANASPRKPIVRNEKGLELG